ncbi:DUF1178 domain-containing protein [Tabrizicola sp. TH137]|uniref:DUF1178 family protein n=1 Tax=Tabrizicola sp. TH137 TaxID=2067452 RepID=UPI000C7A9498|nr:DUF1178 family protein [Tabrizicola sp. TH137]PLL11064.1 DUF1178 domain-containing protein [Tabrizicola sp. TH137]
MIRFSLKCDQDHGFESWFPSGAAYESLKAAGHVSCPVCGSVVVEKALMAPAVRPAREEAGPLRGAETPMEQAIAALKKQVEENSEYVGMNFVAEARRIHQGEAPERSIHGEARPEEAKKLIEEGVPVAPLPFLPARKVQ